MKVHKEVNWDEGIRRTIEEKLEKLERVTTGRELVEKLEALGSGRRALPIAPS